MINPYVISSLLFVLAMIGVNLIILRNVTGNRVGGLDYLGLLMLTLIFGFSAFWVARSYHIFGF